VGIPAHDFGRVQRFIPLVFTRRAHGTGDRSPLSALRSGNWIASSGVTNREMIFFEDDCARLLRRRDAILRSLESIPE
jgi:hypothetical protein